MQHTDSDAMTVFIISLARSLKKETKEKEKSQFISSETESSEPFEAFSQEEKKLGKMQFLFIFFAMIIMIYHVYAMGLFDGK